MRELRLRHHRQLFDTESATETEVPAAKPKNILEAFEHIVEMAERSNLSPELFEKAAVYIRYASRKLRLSPMQTVLLSLFVDRSEDRRILLSEIAGYLNCRTTKILRLSTELAVLENLRYVRASRGRDSLSYRVPSQVLKSLCDNKAYVHEVEPVTDTISFFDRFSSLMCEKRDDEITHDAIAEQTDELLEEIKDTAFAKALRRYDLPDCERILFIFMAHLFVENNDDNICFSDIESLYDNDELPAWCKLRFRKRSLKLFEKNLIENVNFDGMARADAFKLTDEAKNELLQELGVNKIGKSNSGLIGHDTLPEKTLIYNKDESEQIAELASILSRKRFDEVQSRLSKAGMRRGFCCMLYGAPGTGKTETVYQLARMTGRDIMRVDVDKIKSCWVGESEKNIKKLFDRYRSICANSDLAPILLFNEADAVLGVRMEGASKAVDKMENSIQNIILQEMESLDGIMIATTNLTSNLDKAFERRFLYKIRFAKPTEKSRAEIWQSMLPALSDADAAALAARFDLSGGEIENIVRKHSVNAILTGNEDINLETLSEYCRNERITRNSHSKIGF